MAQCDNCGATLKPNATRCIKCGSVIAAPAAPPPQQPVMDLPRSDPQTPREVNVNVHVQPTGYAANQTGQGSYQQPQQYGAPQQGYGPVPTPTYAPQPQVLKSNRGGTIFVMAVLSWTFAPFLPALIGWKMANTDLREIRAGIKDPSSKGLIQFSKFLCIVNVLLGVLLLIVFIIGQAADS